MIHIASIKKKTTIKLLEDVVAAFVTDSSGIFLSAGDGAVVVLELLTGDGDGKLLFPVLGFASQQSDAAHIPVAHVTPVNVSFK